MTTIFKMDHFTLRTYFEDSSKKRRITKFYCSALLLIRADEWIVTFWRKRDFFFSFFYFYCLTTIFFLPPDNFILAQKRKLSYLINWGRTNLAPTKLRSKKVGRILLVNESVLKQYRNNVCQSYSVQKLQKCVFLFPNSSLLAYN